MSRPPRLPDTTISTLITELRVHHPQLTGTQLRAELIKRHGTPGGVTRIYRLLRQTTAPSSSPVAAAPAGHPDPLAQLAHALERARLAEEREDAHQAHWAAEIDALRIRLRRTHAAEQRLPFLEATLRDRSRELTAAYQRITNLEAQLR